MTPIATQELAQVWAELQALAPVAAIHTEQQYEHALETLHTLLDIVGEDENHPLYEVLDTLGALVQTYEAESYPAPEVEGVEVLKFLMDEHRLNPAALPEIGREDEVLAVLGGQRALTVAEIRALARRFQVSPASFI